MKGSDIETGNWAQSGISPEEYAGRLEVIAELWRRIKLEVVVELPMLKQRWKIIVFGILMQYVHGMFTQLAHRRHIPQDEPLRDLGFDLTPELGPDKHWVSESIFGTMFIMFIFWTFTPFITQRKRFYTVVMWSRLLMVLVTCQILRVITFSVTLLPSPGFHCRSDSPTATRPWPKDWTGHVVIDVQNQMSKSCGDLIFSSHTIFMLTGILAYTEYGSIFPLKCAAWACGAIISCLIVASRKHYTVDIVIAWYTVPMVFYSLYRRWTTKRPMSEFLGALGEHDEPDPQDEADSQSEMPLLSDRHSADQTDGPSSSSNNQAQSQRSRPADGDLESRSGATGLPPRSSVQGGPGQSGGPGGLMSGLTSGGKAREGGGAGGASNAVQRSRSTNANMTSMETSSKGADGQQQQQPGCSIS